MNTSPISDSIRKLSPLSTRKESFFFLEKKLVKRKEFEKFIMDNIEI